MIINDPTVTAPPPAVAPVGLVAWWRGENDARDGAGGSEGSVLNGLGFSAGEVGQGFNFDGANDRFTASAAAPASFDFGAGADFSIEAWIKPIQAYTTYGVQAILDKRVAPVGDNQALGYALWLIDGRLGCELADYPMEPYQLQNYGPAGPDLRADGRFHHVAMTVDRDASDGLKLYVDGVVVLTLAPTSEPGDLSNTGLLRIGNHANTSINCYFKGVIDEVSLYNRALSESEIQSIFNAGASGKRLDADNNGLPDDWERRYLGDIGVDPNADADNDGLTNLQEYRAGTNPTLWDTDGDGMSDGFEINYFGDLSPTAEGDYDGDGASNLQEYQEGTNPNTIDFSVTPTSRFVNTNTARVEIEVSKGVPSSMAVLVDTTNFASACWTCYASNMLANVGVVEGWHQIWVGLRGRLTTSQQTWQSTRVKVDLTPPVLVITNPVSAGVGQCLVQLQGYSTEALRNLTYDLTNTGRSISNQPALVVAQTYSAITREFTTNFFQGFDIRLTNGLNTVTLTATDLAGNTVNQVVTLQWVAPTNPPTIELHWPRNGQGVSGKTFTWRGWVDDASAQIRAEWLDGTGATNSAVGHVGRNGDFRIDDIPVERGTNLIAVVATGSAGTSFSTNINVVGSAVTLTLDQISWDSASGTLADPSYRIWVNGHEAEKIDFGDIIVWSADVSLTLDSPFLQVRAIPTTDNDGFGSGPGDNRPSSLGNPDSAQGVDVEAELEWPAAQPYINQYAISEHHDNWPPYYVDADFQWHEKSGGGGGYFGTEPPPLYVDASGSPPAWWYALSWPSGRWPRFSMGTAVTLDDTWGEMRYGPTNAVGPPGGYMSSSYNEHCDADYSSPDGHLTWGRHVQDGVAMLTGGKTSDTDPQLFLISASMGAALDPLAPYNQAWLPVPPEQIMIGALGRLDTNGYLCVLLPPHAEVDLTPSISDVQQSTHTESAVQPIPSGAKQYMCTVYGIQHLLTNLCVATTPSDRSRTNVGVGEEVDCYFSPALPVGVDFKWVCDAGSIYPTSGLGRQIRWTAPSNACSATIKVGVFGGILSKTFNVVQPTGVDHAELRATKNDIPVGWSGAGMHLRPFIGPTNVSFYRVQVREVGRDATNVDGYYNQFTNPPYWPDNLSHRTHGAGQWFGLNYDNSWREPWDNAEWGGDPAPWKSGAFTWLIPGQWKIDSGPTNDLPNGWQQDFAIEASGAMTVNKFSHTVTRGTDGRYTIAR